MIGIYRLSAERREERKTLSDLWQVTEDMLSDKMCDQKYQGKNDI